MNAQAPRLPRIDVAYEDELLGSWFARIAKRHDGPWQQVLEWSGYAPQKWGHPDIRLPEDRFLKLLNILNTNFIEALTQHTTWPYWAALNASDKMIEVEGERLPLLRPFGRQPPTFKAKTREGKYWFCALCWQEDAAKAIDPYWRRSHQLPSAFVCTKHKCMLVSDCVNCGRQPVSNREPNLPGPGICSCGVLPSTARFPSERMRPALEQLAKFSLDMAANGLPNWTGPAMRTHIGSIIRKRWPHHRNLTNSALNALEEFGFRRFGDQWILDLQDCASTEQALVVKDDFSYWSAPAIACVLVVSGLSLAELISGVHEATPSRAISRGGRTPNMAASKALEKSKASLLDAYALNAKANFSHNNRYHYQRVVLLDPNWLVENLKLSPESVFIPSIEEDRRDIEARVAVATSLGRIRIQPSVIRANLRDSEWLGKLLKNNGKRNGRTPENSLTIEGYREAVTRVKERQSCPCRVQNLEVARELAISFHSLYHFCRNNSSCRQVLDEANKDWVERKIRWGLRELISRGEYVSHSKFLREMALGQRKGVRGLLDQVCRAEPQLAANLITRALDTRMDS